MNCKAGDNIVFKNNEDSYHIVKVIETDCYLVQDINDNQFSYKYFGEMTEHAESVASNTLSKRKRMAPSSVSSASTTSSTTSTTFQNWMTKFNVHFKTIASYEEFFGKDISNDVNDNNEFHDLIDMHWDRNFSTDKDIYKDLIEETLKFQSQQSEVSVEDCIVIVFKMVKVSKILKKCKLELGVVDMVIYEESQGVKLRNAIVENKRGGVHTTSNHLKFRSQLGSYMLSAALENYRELKARNEENTFEFQNIAGLLHFGLTPIFYKVQIPEHYIESFNRVINMEDVDMPSLTIIQYAPIEPYIDRELLIRSSRELLFKCYTMFAKLIQQYNNEKTRSLT